jgi:hypothetical protein
MNIYNAYGDFKVRNKIIENMENDDLKLISYDMIKDKKSIIYKVEDDKISGFLTFNYIDKYYKSKTDAMKVSFTGKNLTNSGNSTILITCYYFINNKVFEYDENYQTSNKIDISLENKITFNFDSDIAVISKDNIINEYEVIDIPIGEFIIRKKTVNGLEDQLIKLKTVEEKINIMQYKRELYFEILSDEKNKAILTKNGDKYGQIQGMGINSYIEIYAVKQKVVEGFGISSSPLIKSQPKIEEEVEEFNILILSKSYQIEFEKKDIVNIPPFFRLSANFNWFRTTNSILLKDGGILYLMDLDGITMLVYKNNSLNQYTYSFFINVKGELKHYTPEIGSSNISFFKDDYHINFYENSLYLAKFNEDFRGIKGFTFSDGLFSKDNFTIDDLYYKITEDDIETKFEGINFGMGKYKVKMNSELNDKIDDKEIDIESVPLFLNFDNDKFQIIDNYAMNRDEKLQLCKYTQNSEDKIIFILNKPRVGPIYYDIIDFTAYDKVESLSKFKETLRLPPCEECSEVKECPECEKCEDKICPECEKCEDKICPECEKCEDKICPECEKCEDNGSGININYIFLVVLLIALIYYICNSRRYN